MLGYPGGQELSGQPAVVDELTTTNLGIYQQTVAVHDLYKVMGQIVPGDSGGPFISRAGNVMGVMVANFYTVKGGGYLISAHELITLAEQAKDSLVEISTGECASEANHSLLAPAGSTYVIPPLHW